MSNSQKIIFEQTTSYDLKFPPTKNRRGQVNPKFPFDIKHIYHITTNLFKVPTIVMSDLHSHAPALLKMLNKREDIDMSKYHVIAVGDMAGTHIRGSDGNPTPEYLYLLRECGVQSLTIVQGNHDLPPTECVKSSPQEKQRVQSCIVNNGSVIQSANGTVGGVNGIISNKPHPYKMPFKQYMEFLKRYRKRNLDILLTHDTPRFFYDCMVKMKGGKREKKSLEFIGNDAIYEYVTKYIRPRVYIYGHCYHRKLHTVHNGVHFINADSRVIFFNPLEE